MAKVRRVFMIVLDSLGIGAAPDYAEFGDLAENNTLRRISSDAAFSADTVRRLGMAHVEGVDWLGRYGAPGGYVCRLRERSRGKDTTSGHWELAGVVSERAMPTYPNGFPPEIIEAFSQETGRGVLGNCVASGTKIIEELGQAHVETGKLIVYTSADSVFQIAAHESVVPPEQLYEYCRIARRLLQGEHGVGRVIARPFVGEAPHFTRTANRRDFSLVPPRPTMLDAIAAKGLSVIGVGKISDIFAGQGITESIHTHSNAEGMEVTAAQAKRDFQGLCFVNLVDFDSAYGHRNDVHGYAAAFALFDAWLRDFLPLLGEDDALLITADHGCDPGDVSTDHTREYVPMLLYGKKIVPGVGGTRPFADVSSIVCDLLDVEYAGDGTLSQPGEEANLLAAAESARIHAYAPYSGYRVGAALLCEDGSIWTGANVENASYGATSCAERNAIQSAVSHGAKHFSAIAIVGGRGVRAELASPCGICRQVLSEHCDPETFRVILQDGDTIVTRTLGELLPLSFGVENLKK